MRPADDGVITRMRAIHDGTGGVMVQHGDIFFGGDQPTAIVEVHISRGSDGAFQLATWDGEEWEEFQPFVLGGNSTLGTRQGILTDAGVELWRLPVSLEQQRTTVSGIEKYWIRCRTIEKGAVDPILEKIKLFPEFRWHRIAKEKAASRGLK